MRQGEPYLHKGYVMTVRLDRIPRLPTAQLTNQPQKPLFLLSTHEKQLSSVHMGNLMISPFSKETLPARKHRLADLNAMPSPLLWRHLVYHVSSMDVLLGTFLCKCHFPQKTVFFIFGYIPGYGVIQEAITE